MGVNGYSPAMHRHRLHTLRGWLDNPRRKPLVIRGARQVGKSTLVELFCEAAGRGLVAVNLERIPIWPKRSAGPAPTRSRCST